MHTPRTTQRKFREKGMSSFAFLITPKRAHSANEGAQHQRATTNPYPPHTHIHSLESILVY